MSRTTKIAISVAAVVVLAIGVGAFLLLGMPAGKTTAAYSSPHAQTTPANGTAPAADLAGQTANPAPVQKEDLWILAHEDWAISKNIQVPQGPAGWAVGFGPFYQPIRIPFPSSGQAPLMDGASAAMLAQAYGQRMPVSVVPVTPDNTLHLVSVPGSHNNRLQHILAFWNGTAWLPLATIEGYRSERPLLIEPTSATALFSEDVRAQRNLISTQALAAYLGEIASIHPEFRTEVSAEDAQVAFERLSWTTLPGQQSLDVGFTIRSTAGRVSGKLGVDAKPLAAGVTLLTLRTLAR